MVAAFQEAKKAGGRQNKGDSSIFALYKDFPSPPGEEAVDEEWAEGPVQHLLTPKKKADFAGRSDSGSRREFVEAFWKARDSRPETPENEFRSEFQRRAAFSDQRFAQGERRGSLTDRGMVFVLLGPPTYIGRKPLTNEDAPGPAVGGEGFSPIPSGRRPSSRGLQSSTLRPTGGRSGITARSSCPPGCRTRKSRSSS